MVAAYVDRTDCWVISGAAARNDDAAVTRRTGHLRLVPAGTAPPSAMPARDVVDTADPFERAGLRVGRAIGRLGLRLSPPTSVTPARVITRPVALSSQCRQAGPSTRGKIVPLHGATAPTQTAATAPVGWGQVKQALDVVDALPPLRAALDPLLGPWGLDLVIVAGAVVGLLYPGNPLGIVAGHGELVDLAVPLLKVALGALLSPLAVEIALALLGLGRLLWSRRTPAPGAALGA